MSLGDATLKSPPPMSEDEKDCVAFPNVTKAAPLDAKSKSSVDASATPVGNECEAVAVCKRITASVTC